MLCLSARRRTSSCTWSAALCEGIRKARWFYTFGPGPWGFAILILQKRRQSTRPPTAGHKLPHAGRTCGWVSPRVSPQPASRPSSPAGTQSPSPGASKAPPLCPGCPGSSRTHGLNCFNLRTPQIPCWLLPPAGSQCRTTASQSKTTRPCQGKACCRSSGKPPHQGLSLFGGLGLRRKTLSEHMSHVRCQGARVRMHCTAASSSVHVPLSRRSSGQKGLRERTQEEGPPHVCKGAFAWASSSSACRKALDKQSWAPPAQPRREGREAHGTESAQSRARAARAPGRRTPGADHSPKRPRWPSPARRAEGADSTRGSRRAFGTTPCPLAATAPRKVELKTPQPGFTPCPCGCAVSPVSAPFGFGCHCPRYSSTVSSPDWTTKDSLNPF